ncbi:Nitrate reductase, beta subunit, partial [human gut metagenome]
TSDVYLPDAHEMRVPVQYLANLFTAGNTEILARTLQRVLDMREYMRRRETGDGPIEHKVDLTEDQMYGMYKLLALSKYNDRFVIPSDVK